MLAPTVEKIRIGCCSNAVIPDKLEGPFREENFGKSFLTLLTSELSRLEPFFASALLRQFEKQHLNINMYVKK